MATGEKKFSTQGREAQKREFPQVPAGEHDGKLLTSNAEIKKRPEPGKLPYINFRIEALDTAGEGESKNRSLFHMLFLKMTPGKNGYVMVDGQDQLVGLARALGEDTPAFDVIEMDHIDDDGVKTKVDVVNPQQVLKWLKERDGSIVKFRSKMQKGRDGYGDSAKVDYFIESAEGVSSGPDAEDEEGPFDEAPAPVEEPATVRAVASLGRPARVSATGNSAAPAAASGKSRR